MSLGFHVPPDAFAADGDVTSTVEINSSTANCPVLSNGDLFGGSLVNIGNLDGESVNDIASGERDDDDDGGSERGAIHIMFMAESPSTTTSGRRDKSNYDSNEFLHNNSLRVYNVTYNIETNEFQVPAYSTCGAMSAKMITPMQQSVLGLSLEPILLDDYIVIYSRFLDESEEKFNIVIQNKRH